MIKGCRPSWRTLGVLIPSPCVKTTPEPFIFKVYRPVFGFFLLFSSNKRWWQLRAFSFLGRCTHEPCVTLPLKGRLRQPLLNRKLGIQGHHEISAHFDQEFSLFLVLIYFLLVYFIHFKLFNLISVVKFSHLIVSI